MRYAQVVVLLPVDRRIAESDDDGLETLVNFDPASQTFTYGIPPALRGRLQPGHAAWVPFGRTRQQGVVLTLSEQPPPDVKIKPLDALIMAEPALAPAQIELAQWLCRHYLAPLSECVRMLLPPGFGATSRLIVEWTPGSPIFPEELTPAQQALLLHLQKHPLPMSELRQIDRRLAADDVLGDLLDKGLARLRDEIIGGPPRPKTERRVRLLIPPDRIDAALSELGRPSKQAEALRWLRDHPDAEPSAPELARAVGGKPALVADLAGKGWVEITADGRVRLAVGASAVADLIVELRGAGKYRAVLAALARAGDEPLPASQLYAEANADAATLRKLADAGLIGIEEVEVWRDPLAVRHFPPDQPPSLTEDQRRAWERIAASQSDWLGDAPEHSLPSVFLLHGVTGSGKTELYLRALQAALDAGRQAIVLVPEISLTPQTLRRFAARFPGRVAVLHSKLSEGERFDTWRRARAGEFDIIIGSRSALFTPFPRVGVIVVDEEHDPAYKQARTPRYHARDAAVELARLHGAVTLLGSATPSLESSYAAQTGAFTQLDLPRRVMGHGAIGETAEMLELPPVQIVDMRAELRAGNRSMFSQALAEALRAVLARGEQAILFLNRRGSATFVLCRDCGHVLHCPRCAVPLTHHNGEVLICHHCNHREPMPATCPKCGGRRLREFGAGTQRVIESLQAEFPAARPLQWDRDTTGGKTSHEDILHDFIAHKADVLVGTQMIAKGLDLPLVTLVGVLSADVGLFLPDFRAAERTFQVLTQVAGRAGRSARGGQVIFQTYHPGHYAVLAASEHDYAAFYEQEMQFRAESHYPPYARLTRLLYLDSNPARCQRETTRVAEQLKRRAASLGLPDIGLIGPAPAFFSRERDRFRWHLLFRADDPAPLLAGVTLTPSWRIDVDPVETL